MKKLKLEILETSYFPNESSEPLWKESVPRWNQLDSYAYAVAQAAFEWKNNFEKPDLIFLASPLASNDTDFAFTMSGSTSPSKFTHTLPNIRSSPFCQILGWTGPTICIQNDPKTVISSLKEGFECVGVEYKRVLILTVVKSVNCYKVYGFEICEGSGALMMKKCDAQTEEIGKTDASFLTWLNEKSSTFSFDDYEIFRKD